MTTMTDAELEPYFRGERLYGDDLPPDAIAQWYRDEERAYFDLLHRSSHHDTYAYHALNRLHGFRYLPDIQFQHALGFGSAGADEFEPILNRVRRITVLEPAEQFARESVGGVPARYVRPSIDGKLPFHDGEFDLVTCFGALHHVPNPSRVLHEIGRCTAPGGYALIREPITSLGDWRRPRAGLTMHERGIPIRIFRRIVDEAGFGVLREASCMFPAIPRIARLLGTLAYSVPTLTLVDRALCRLTQWNTTYHRRLLWQKCGPWAVFLVLRRRSPS